MLNFAYKLCINVDRIFCFSDDEERNAREESYWRFVFGLGLFCIIESWVLAKWAKKFLSILWHSNCYSELRNRHFFVILFTESSFARFSAVLRHGHRNANNLFSYLTKLNVSIEEHFIFFLCKMKCKWCYNPRHTIILMPKSKTITITFHLVTCGIKARWYTPYYSNITSCSTVKTKHFHYLLPSALSPPFKHLDDVLVHVLFNSPEAFRSV